MERDEHIRMADVQCVGVVLEVLRIVDRAAAVVVDMEMDCRVAEAVDIHIHSVLDPAEAAELVDYSSTDPGTVKVAREVVDRLGIAAATVGHIVAAAAAQIERAIVRTAGH